MYSALQKEQRMIQKRNEDVPGGPVVKNLPVDAGKTGSIPGPGRFHMPQNN